MFTFLHTNLNVKNLAESIAFYQEALGLKEASRKVTDTFTLVFLTDGVTAHTLELTWLADHPQPYELGDNETHIAFQVDDYAAAHALHQQMGCICFENEGMGIYFIEDPDGYWLEIIPGRNE